jgi:hypothetical protein
MPQMQAPAPAPAPAAPMMPKHPLGWSDTFQAGVTRDRALRQYKGGTFADMKARGEGDQAAARQAFAQTQLASADMATGGFFEQRGLNADANTRANQGATADAGFKDSQASLNTAKADIEVPAQAAVGYANADRLDQQTARDQRMLPIDAQAGQINNAGNAARAMYAGPAAAAQVGQMQAQTAATTANAGAMPDQLKAAQARIAHLERLLNQKQGGTDDAPFGNVETPAAAGTPATAPAPAPQRMLPVQAGVAAQPSPQPTAQPQQPQAAAPQQDVRLEDLEHTARLHGISVEEVKQKLGLQ